VCTKAAQNLSSTCYLVNKKTEEVAAVKACPEWIFGNRDANGYYRVFYQDPKNPDETVAAAAEKYLTVPERIAFVEDLGPWRVQAKSR